MTAYESHQVQGGEVIETVGIPISLSDCAVQCLQDPRCSFVNVKQYGDLYTCELLHKTGNGTQVVPQDDSPVPFTVF